MALFADEGYVDVPTPDGRIVKVPKSVAASLVGGGMSPPSPGGDAGFSAGGAAADPLSLRRGGAAPLDSEVPGARTGVPAGAFAGSSSLPTSSAPSQDAPPALPESFPLEANPSTPVGAALGKRTDAKPKAKPTPGSAPGAPAAPAAPKLPTFAENAQETADAAAKQADAAKQIALNDELSHHMAAAAYEDQEKRSDKIFADTKAQLDDMNARIAKKNAFADQMLEKYQNTKIDRSMDHPVLATIGVALAGLGAAMAGHGDKNPALDAMWASLDRKVAGQMQDLERTGKVIGMTREQVASLQSELGNKRNLADFLLAGEASRAANAIKAITENSASANAKANGDMMIAGIMERTAGLRAGITQNAVTADIHREQIKQQDIASQRSAAASNYATASAAQTAKNHLAAEEKWRSEDRDAQLAEKIAQYSAQGNKSKADALEKSKETNAEQAIGNVRGGLAPGRTTNWILTPDGNKKLRQAEALEIEAKDTEGTEVGANPAKAAMRNARATALREQASNLRTEAEHLDTWKIKGAGREAFANEYSAAQSAIGFGEDIKKLYDQHGKAWLESDAGQAALAAVVTQHQMALKSAWKLGVMSKLDLTTIQSATGGNPGDAWNDDTIGTIAHELGAKYGKDPEAFKGGLDQLSLGMKQQAFNTAATHNFTGKMDELFPSAPDTSGVRDTAAKVTGGQTLGDAMEKDNPTLAGRVVGAVLHPLDAIGGQTDGNYNERQLADENVNFKQSGVGKEAYNATTDLIAKAKAGEAAAAQLYAAKRSATELPNEAKLKAAAAEGDRAKGMITELTKDPKLGGYTMKRLIDEAPTLYSAAKASGVHGIEATDFVPKPGNTYRPDAPAAAAKPPTATPAQKNAAIMNLAQRAIVGDADAEARLKSEAVAGDATALAAYTGVQRMRAARGGH